ncbi:methylmalonyl-CoA epimerase [bacterium (candidate division B38) B3_B38]|nr:MAG: methylmalonyl-CoA epimerase [bacterium (candidate division B38) B3_B38]
MLIKLDHIGIAVNSLEEALPFFRDCLGMNLIKIEVVEAQRVRVAFLSLGSETIELIEGTDEQSPIRKFIAKKGEGIHHLCFQVPNLEKSLKELKRKGVRLVDEIPRQGAAGARVAFLHPASSHGVLIELKEEKG